MKSIIATLFCIFFASTILHTEDNPLWMRYPSISPDGENIAFTYKGDLYTVPSEGGEARQLTYHKAHDYMPVWSPDGKNIAFASDRYGNFDLFIMAATGGPATRLTYHSANEKPYSFSTDGSQIYFGAVRQDRSQHRQYPTSSQGELYSVSANGGAVRQVFTIPAENVQSNKQGDKFLYQDMKGYENEWRKHHTSSITRDIWLYDKNTDTHSMLIDWHGEDRQPVFSTDEGSIYFLSERSGSFNVFKKSLSSASKEEQLTFFDKHPIRFLSVGNGTICFGFNGEIYTMEEGKEAQKISINIITQDGDNKDKILSINGGIREMDVSPDGKEVAFVSRGEVFVTSVDKSFTKRITTTPGNERFVSFGHDGKSVVYSREEGGNWNIYQSMIVRKEEPFFYASTLVNEKVLVDLDQDAYLGKVSPDGKKLAFVYGRRTLRIMDLTTKASVDLLTPQELFHMSDGDKYYTWSPDSKWLLVEWGKTLSNSDILLVAADGSKRINLNDSGYYDGSPKWVNDGKQMIWTSNKEGLKSYATSGQSQSDVYMMFFDQEAWDKFNLNKEENELMKEIEEQKEEENKDSKKEKDDKGKKDEKKSKEEVKPLNFDWARMKDRKSRLTIHSSDLGDAVLSKDGETLYYLARFEEDMNLWSTNLRTKETKMAIPLGVSYGSLMWDKDMKNLFLLAGGSISIIDTEGSNQKPVKINAEIPFDTDAERRAMFDHVSLRTANIFYHPDFHGINWSEMSGAYSKFLPHIGNSYEFAELLSELLGELNVSHAGANFRGGDSNGDNTASLGIFMDWDYTGNGIRIDEIIEGGPLDKANFKVKKGDIITKINGEVIDQNTDVSKYLNRLAGKFTLLDIVDGKNKASTQQITLKPISLGEENRLLYKRWVKNNRLEVEAASEGRLGYVHIPGMSDGPYRTIYEDMMGKYADADAVIVDTRFNGGGDLVADLAMFFTGEPFITYATEAKVVGGEPTSRWTKPTLALFNESMYSDGHCFACGYTDLKIGKTVGMPVPGTCSFAGWEGLPDGTSWGVVPVSAKDKQGKWMENEQTNPTILVKNMPGIIDNGRDQQLERAIEELMKDIRG